MMTFERTRDMRLVREILTHPRIYPHISDDLSPVREQFRPVEHDSLWYVLVRDGAELLGLFLFQAVNGATCEVHTCLLPNAWGRRARTAAREVAGWIWQNTRFQRIVTTVPESNRLAYKLALRSGMNVYGVNPKSWLKGGKLEDLILLGLSKGGV